MDDKISNESLILSQTYYLPVHIDKLEKVLMNTNEDMTSFPCILVVSNGSVLLTLNGHQYTLSRGSVVLWDDYNDVKLTAQTHTTLQGTLIQYRSLTNDGTKPHVFKHHEPLRDCSLKILTLTEELDSVSRRPTSSKPFYFQQLFLELLADIYEELEGQRQQINVWMEQVLHYIDYHFHEDLTREQMAEMAQVSPEHFSRTFRKHTGQTFSNYLALLRIRASQQQLLYEMPKLNTLAQEVGYREGTYLSRKFKQLVGLSPTAYHHKQKRVVSLNCNHTANLLALGVIPELGVYSPWLEGMMDVNPMQKLYPCERGVHSFYENVAAAHPDVIIDYNTAKGNKALLPLAPVLGLPFMKMSWREQFRLIAGIVERQREAEEWLAHYDEQIRVFNQKLDRQFGARGTAIVWEMNTNSAYCINSSYGRGSQILYQDLGFQVPNQILEEGIEVHGYLEKEIEAIAYYAADHIFITSLPSNPMAKKRINRLFQSEPWLKMEAIQQKRVYLIDQPNLFYGYDPLSSKAQLRELMRVLTS